jgi:GNAT superfamily N-acetyltransferase
MTREARIHAPEHLTDRHDLWAFDSGVPVLNNWLKKRALANDQRGASRTYVITAGERVVGYYALAAGAVAMQQATGRIGRDMPDPIPVMVLGRLAVVKAFQGRGLGAALLRDSVLRTRQAADVIGIRAMVVHAIAVDAKRFYERYGFTQSPIDPMTQMISLADLDKIAAPSSRFA